MPPVQTAAAAKRRKLSTQDSMGIARMNASNPAHRRGGDAPHITESQKRIKAILDKNGERSLLKVGNTDIDAIGSFTIKQPNTHRDLKSLDEMRSIQTGGAETCTNADPPKLMSTMQQKVALEVTDRLYNKK